ncbi:hypothetical protein RHO13_08430 [Orbus wheelerorum]|uniref:hypothetical protein n=1 Tax=Orbus wheelerorum TaxID=3074111 RepID=UPI00370DB776
MNIEDELTNINDKKIIAVNTQGELDEALKMKYYTIFVSVELSTKLKKRYRKKNLIGYLFIIILLLTSFLSFFYHFDLEGLSMVGYLCAVVLFILNYIKYKKSTFYRQEFNPLTRKYTFTRSKYDSKEFPIIH